MAKRIANYSNPTTSPPVTGYFVVPPVYVVVVVDTPMVDAPAAVLTVDSVDLEIITVRAFLERSVVPAEWVSTMYEAVAKLVSVLYSRSFGSNTTVSVEVLETPASE